MGVGCQGKSRALSPHELHHGDNTEVGVAIRQANAEAQALAVCELAQHIEHAQVSRGAGASDRDCVPDSI